MANHGVFNRNENVLTPVPRSRQNLSFRHTFTTRFGQITPKGDWLLLPHESIDIRNTDFIRTIPMKTPQLSRIRIVTRFVAVPLRLLWRPFEDYIDPTKDERFVESEPHVANFNAINGFITQYFDITKNNFIYAKSNPYSSNLKSNVAQSLRSHNANVSDLSTIGIAVAQPSTQVTGSTPNSWARAITFDSMNTDQGLFQYPHTSFAFTDTVGYQFFPHELGDYFNCPTYVACLWSDTSSRISAWKFGAYQLAYSYLYRMPNVQTRVDDYYQMAQLYDDELYSEYPSFYADFDTSKGIVPPVSQALTALAEGAPRDSDVFKSINPTGIRLPTSGLGNVDIAKLEGISNVRMTSWEGVEKFPLKSGPNISLISEYMKNDGTIEQIPTRISLTRIRFANWQMDRFTSANPWQQRGDEAQIPVSGSVSFSDLGFSVTVTPSGTVSSTFYGDAANAHLPLLDRSGNLSVALANQGSLDNGDTTSASWFVQNDSDSEYVFDPPTGITAYDNVVHTGTVHSTFNGTPQTYNGSVTGGSASVSSLYVSPSNFRFAMQLQKIKEMSARTDGRYKSFLSMFYGSKSRDARLDRPEFIGGFIQDLDVSEITQTTPTADSPLGSMAGRGISAKRSSHIHYTASEHTVILALQHIIPDSEYVGGLNRVDHMIDPFDYPLPQFAGLSEQPIRMSELVCRASKLDSVVNTDNDEVFGYEPRYNEKRAKHSYCTGAFRDYFNTTGGRDYYQPWLITRNFGFDVSLKVSNSIFLDGLSYTVPSLSDEFLSMRHTVDNSNFEVSNEQEMYPFMCDSYFDVQWTTVLPRRGIPRL